MHIVIFYISNQSLHCLSFVIFSWIWHPNLLNCLHNNDNDNDKNRQSMTVLGGTVLAALLF